MPAILVVILVAGITANELNTCINNSCDDEEVLAPGQLPERRAKHVDIAPYQRTMNKTVPTVCPKLRKPTNVHTMVINLDRSTGRLKRMADMFTKLDLPMFERIAGVEVKEDGVYDVKRHTKHLKPADYGCCLAHREAWKAIVSGGHEWVLVLEDDTIIPEADLVLDLPPVPDTCELTFMNPLTVNMVEPICDKTTVQWAHWGYGTIGYYLNKQGAAKLIERSKNGFGIPLDGHLWYEDVVCVTSDVRLKAEPCGNPCEHSVRTWLNGELEKEPE